MTYLQQKIHNLKNRIKSLKESLPYADGQAYYDDERKIAELSAELTYWKNLLKYDQKAA